MGVSGFHRLESETSAFMRVSSHTGHGQYCGFSIFLVMDRGLRIFLVQPISPFRIIAKGQVQSRMKTYKRHQRT